MDLGFHPKTSDCLPTSLTTNTEGFQLLNLTPAEYINIFQNEENSQCEKKLYSDTSHQNFHLGIP